MAPTKVGINGFGRIGRCTFKILSESSESLEIVGINDLADTGDLAYMLKYDSVYGGCGREVDSNADSMVVDGKSIPFLSEADPRRLPWGDLGAEVIIECTGAFRERAKAAGHIEAGAKKVIVSAPSRDVDGTFVPGVNETGYEPGSHDVVSLASCTTNCIAPVLKVLHESFGVSYASFTTVHAYTSSQSVVDTPSRKRRRGRAAAVNIAPTTSGAAGAVELVLPDLKGRVHGMAMRVPVPCGSISDLVVGLEEAISVEKVNGALREATEKPGLQGILGFSEDDLVSRDIIGDAHSAVVDGASTLKVDDNVVKVLAWYDNEWGYSARLVDFARYIADRL